MATSTIALILFFIIVNVLKLKLNDSTAQLSDSETSSVTAWDNEAEFDAGKDKSTFRQYEDACDRVKLFYKEQHGKLSRRYPPHTYLLIIHLFRKTNS